jgi:2'-5' RNA ligase
MSGRPIRAFLGLEIPETVRSKLANAVDDLRRELPRARWTRPLGWHLTLKFLGETDRNELAALTAELAPRVRGLEPVSVDLSKTGFFPSTARPRVAWLGGSATGAEAVVDKVEEAAEITGFRRERRPWSVHLTLARLKERWPEVAVKRFLAWGEGLDLKRFTCPEVVLFSSDLQPGGAVYTALERFSFR